MISRWRWGVERTGHDHVLLGWERGACVSVSALAFPVMGEERCGRRQGDGGRERSKGGERQSRAALLNERDMTETNRPERLRPLRPSDMSVGEGVESAEYASKPPNDAADTSRSSHSPIARSPRTAAAALTVFNRSTYP